YDSGEMSWFIDDEKLWTEKGITLSSLQVALGVLSMEEGPAQINLATFDNLRVSQREGKTPAFASTSDTSYLDSTGEVGRT
ncbi:MAG: hypothetical protein COS84_06470, partial [Armatimonadetes bacterium CG07_land_8_20_14_0_80_40_9]